MVAWNTFEFLSDRQKIKSTQILEDGIPARNKTNLSSLAKFLPYENFGFVLSHLSIA